MQAHSRMAWTPRPMTIQDRFRNFIASRSRATPLAVGYAVSSIQQGLNYAIQENTDPSGQPLMGTFVVTVDDGSGSPSPHCCRRYNPRSTRCGRLDRSSACSPRRVQGRRFPHDHRCRRNSQGAGPGARRQRNRLLHQQPPIGASLPLTRLAQIAYSANPAVLNVSALLANGSSERRRRGSQSVSSRPASSR